VDDEDGIEVLL